MRKKTIIGYVGHGAAPSTSYGHYMVDFRRLERFDVGRAISDAVKAGESRRIARFV